MAFEPFQNISINERSLLDQLTRELQSNYTKYQDKCFYLKLSKAGEKLSEIIWIKEFPDAYALIDFYYDSKYRRACIMIKFHNEHYEILCEGFFTGDWFEIWPNEVLNDYPSDGCEDLEDEKMFSRELIEKAFGEMTRELSTVKRRKAV